MTLLSNKKVIVLEIECLVAAYKRYCGFIERVADIVARQWKN